MKLLESTLTLQCKKVLVTYFSGLMMAYWSLKTSTEPELRYIRNLCDPKKIMIDVGAYVGAYTVACWPHSKICYTFEPQPALANRLSKLFANLKDRIIVEEIALSDRAGVTLFRVPSGAVALATIAQGNSLSQFREVDTRHVEVRRLDDYGLGPVGFIKIDVEGHEEAVVDGASETIARDRPNLMIEIEERHNPGGLVRLASTLQTLGYEGWFLMGGRFRPLSEFYSLIYGGQSVGGPKTPYINNFIFSCELRLGDRLSSRH